MSDNPLSKDSKLHRKVIEPLPGKSVSKDAEPAVDMIRSKIAALYGDEQKKPEPEAKPTTEAAKSTRSKHQKYMDELSGSGRSLAEIQEAWHSYYQRLSDHEKHQVWEEFYAEYDKGGSTKKTNPRSDSSVHPPQQTAPHTAEPVRVADKRPQAKRRYARASDPRSVSEVKKQIVGKVRSRSKPKNPHLQSLVFGLGMGVIVMVIMLFGFFNERIIAPFITPSRTVSSTPIITDPNSTVVGKDPKIIIPKINVEIPVVYDEPSVQEAAVQQALERGVLHYATTPNPGEKGNAVIFGHSSNNILNSGKYKFAFVLLSRLENGDTFMLEKGGTRYVYKIFDKKIVSPTDLSVLKDYEGKSTATLITCDPPGTSINRLVVVGEQISPSPNGNVASSAESKATSQAAILPSNSPSLWSRMTSWL